MADRYLLESGAPDGYLLEDSSGVLLLEVQGPFQTCQTDFVSGRDQRRYQLGAIDFIPNLLIATLAVTTVLRDPSFAQKQDLSNPRLHVQAQQVVNLLPLGQGAVASPFIGKAGETVQRPLQVLADTSLSTPKTLYEDVSFAPAQSEFQTIPRFIERLADTSFRNEALLNQPVTAPFIGKEFPTIPRPIQVFGDTSYRNNAALAPAAAAPFVPVDFSNIPWQKWLPGDTSQDSSPALLNPNPFWGYPQVSAPVLIRTLPDTSQSSPQTLFVQVAPPFIGYVPPNTPDLKRGVVDTSEGTPLPLLTTPVAAPFFNPTFDVIRPPFNVADTSRGTPLPLLTAPVFPPFYQTDFPSPIEYRFQSWWTIDPQIYPEFIPPPAPPVQRVEIDGGVPKKRKSAKEERDELLDIVVKEVLTPAKPAPDLPSPLKPVQTVKQVVEDPPKAVQLTMVDEIELPDEDDKIIAALIAAGLF